MKPRLWKMHGVWWCGSYVTIGGLRIALEGSECNYFRNVAYKLWKDNQ